MTESLTLKWGTIKSWDGFGEKSMEILGRYYADGVPMSAAMDHPNDDRKRILCELIDAVDCEEIYLDWDDKYVSKDDAKKYVREYGQKT